MGLSHSKCDGKEDLPPLPPKPDEAGVASKVKAAMDLVTGDEAQDLKSPGNFEGLQVDVRKLTSLGTYEGCKVEIGKQLTPMFAQAHAFWLGGSYYPQMNQHYNARYTLQTIGAENESVIIANIDQMGTLEGHLIGTMLGSLLQGKLMFNMPANHPTTSVADLDLNGKNAAAQLRLANNFHGQPGCMVGCSYVQALTPRLALGGEGSCNLEQASATLTAAAKYTAPTHSATATYTRGTSAQAQDSLSLQYYRPVNKKVALGSELQLNPATFDANFSTGAEFKLKQSTVNVCVDGTGKMQSMVEMSFATGSRLGFSAEMQFMPRDESGKSRDHYKFGYSLSLGQ